MCIRDSRWSYRWRNASIAQLASFIFLRYLYVKFPMYRLPLPILFFFLFIDSNAQDPAKVAISTTGCTIQVFCFPGRFDAYDLEDGSTVYADDCDKEGVTYGIYCVKLKK